ncbi:P-loop NTPase [Mycoplasmatota bacterium WC44]
MFTEENVRASIEILFDPTSGKTLKETNGIRKISIDQENKKVHIIIALDKLNTPEQEDLQFEMVKTLKVDLGFHGVKFEYTTHNTRAQGETTILGPDSNVKFIAVASGKGGVGKSTVTANLAVALARLGKKVGIIDADIYGSSIAQVMQTNEQPVYEDNLFTPVSIGGIEIMTTSMLLGENKPLMWRGPMLSKILKNFFHDTKWSEDIEFILIDLPPGTGDVALDIQNFIPQSKQLLVTTPHPNAAHVAVRAGLMAQHLNHPIIGVIENMSYLEIDGNRHNVFGIGGGEAVANQLETNLLGQIPLGQPENGKMHSIYLKEDNTSKIFDDLVSKVIKDFS